MRRPPGAILVSYTLILCTLITDLFLHGVTGRQLNFYPFNPKPRPPVYLTGGLDDI